MAEVKRRPPPLKDANQAAFNEVRETIESNNGQPISAHGTAQQTPSGGNGPVSPGPPSTPSGTFAYPDTPGNSLPLAAGGHPQRDKEKKIGHRRVDKETGQVTYKRFPTSQLQGALQEGMRHSISKLAQIAQTRDVLYQDFSVVENVHHPKNFEIFILMDRDGSSTTVGHPFSDFRFKTYAPVAFRYFRDLFALKTSDFLVSLCDMPLIEISNPGASGSIFYITNDGLFIIKTVQAKEAEFLQRLLAGYFMNLSQNARTLLPKFFGLFCYQSLGKNVRMIVMNNLFPREVTMHEKYDVKGSTFKRKASKRERRKACPTYKDLDFLQFHSDGLLLEPDIHDQISMTIRRDCAVLESFKIMDYSLLIGVHNIDEETRRRETKRESLDFDDTLVPGNSLPEHDGRAFVESGDAAPTTQSGRRESVLPEQHQSKLARHKSISYRQNLAAFKTEPLSTPESSSPSLSGSVDAAETLVDKDVEINPDAYPWAIPARNKAGDRLLLFMGIIDILQSYRFRKKLEHSFKSVLYDGSTVSVCHPGFYAKRFQTFMTETVFTRSAEVGVGVTPGERRRSVRRKLQTPSSASAARTTPIPAPQRVVSRVFEDTISVESPLTLGARPTVPTPTPLPEPALAQRSVPPTDDDSELDEDLRYSRLDSPTASQNTSPKNMSDATPSRSTATTSGVSVGDVRFDFDPANAASVDRLNHSNRASSDFTSSSDSHSTAGRSGSHGDVSAATRAPSGLPVAGTQRASNIAGNGASNVTRLATSNEKRVYFKGETGDC